jgi:hypothetical protein
MKIIIFLLVPLYLKAYEPKKIEWFPQKIEVNKAKIPCEGTFQEINPWQIRPWENRPNKKVEVIKSSGDVTTCNLLNLKI